MDSWGGVILFVALLLLLFLWKRKRKPKKPQGDPYLDAPLLYFSEHDAYSVRQSFQGCLVTGEVGSGKSSGSGKYLARAMLQAGYGGLILMAKQEDLEFWTRLAKETNREQDLATFGIEGKDRFNFLTYELLRPGGGLTDNIVNLFQVLLKVGSKGANAEQDFFMSSALLLLKNVIDVLKFGQGTLSVADILKVINTAPPSIEHSQSIEWQQSSFASKVIWEATQKWKNPKPHDLQVAADYLLATFPSIDPKTRSSIVATLLPILDSFNRGIMHDLFGGETTIVPECIFDGKLWIINLPVNTYGTAGRFAQMVIKYLCQQAILRRNIDENSRGVMIFADEAQNFISPRTDFAFLSQSRSYRAATFLLTQNIQNLYAAASGDSEREAIDSLLATLVTKIFHRNNGKTNEWASELIGKTKQSKATFGHSGGRTDSGHNSSHSASSTEVIQEEILPREFQQLRNGTQENDFLVDGIVFQSGRVFNANGKTFIKCTFNQQN